MSTPRSTALTALAFALGFPPHLTAGPPPIVLKVQPEGAKGPLIVGQTVVVDVSIRARLPAGDLGWTLFVERHPKASGGLERLAGEVPRRNFAVEVILDHNEFVLAREASEPDTRARLGVGGPPPVLVRNVRFELVLHKREDPDAVVAKGATSVRATCATNDTDPRCDKNPSPIGGTR